MASTGKRAATTVVSLLVSFFAGVAIPASETSCPIFPRPKEYKATGEQWTLAPDAELAVVVADDAPEPERYAADRMRSHLRLRFGRNVAVKTEKEVGPDVKQVVFLGRPDGNGWVKRLCETEKIDLSPTSPGMNGFVLRFLKDGERQIMLVGGCDVSGTIYGGDALFDLMHRSGDAVNVQVASVRDWPSIPWRGRPHSVLHHHLVPGAMDAYIRGRINFSDIRDNPKVAENYFYPARKASMGLPAGQALDVPPISEAIREFHRRGIFVYGTVDCAVPKAKYDVLLETFRKLIELGVDGIWISLDDTGAGEDPKGMVRTVLDFGKRHGMTGRKVAYTPPPAEYQNIDKPLNHEMAKIPGFDEIMWFFTRVPCKADLETTRSMGLKLKPGWWFNLADGGIQGGITHSGGIMVSTRKGKPGYLDLVPMSHGWGTPKYEAVQDADRFTDQVLLWAVCDGWPEEYEVVMLGQWAWNPEGYDWNEQRRAIYRYLYGPEGVEIAFEYDDVLAELENKFLLPRIRYTPNLNWPPRLKNRDDRESVLKQAARLRELSERLSAVAPKESAVERDRLETVYLEPMRATAEYARIMATLDYPEYRFEKLGDRFFTLIREGKTDEMEKRAEEARPVVLEQLEKIGAELKDLKAIDEYVAHWKRRVEPASAEKNDSRRAARDEAKWKEMTLLPAAGLMPYRPDATEADLMELFATIEKPPQGGTPLAEIDPSEWLKSIATRGPFLVGPFRRGDVSCTGIGLPAHTATKIGDYGQIRLSVPVPKHEGKLVADLFVADTRLDNQRNVRKLSLFINGRPAWEQDIALDQRGKEWITIDLTDMARGAEVFDCVFTVLEQQAVAHHASTVLVGPLRFRDMPK